MERKSSKSHGNQNKINEMGDKLMNLRLMTVEDNEVISSSTKKHSFERTDDHKKFFEPLREYVEGPICLNLHQSPVMCRNGHYNCNNDEEAFAILKEHQRMCKYRLVRCPGKGITCSNLICFADLERHVKNCKDVHTVSGNSSPLVFTLNKKLQEWKGDLYWATSFPFDGNMCFLKVARITGVFRVELIMDETEEKCNELTAEISILNSKDQAVLKSCLPPTPISQNAWGDLYLMFPEAVMTKVWRYNEKDNKYWFSIDVHIFEATTSPRQAHSSSYTK